MTNPLDPALPADDELAQEPALPTGLRSRTGTRLRSGAMRFAAPTEEVLDAARDQVRARPLSSAGVAFAIGFLLAVITR